MDEHKKKMLIIGGISLLAIMVIVLGTVMLHRKKKVETSHVASTMAMRTRAPTVRKTVIISNNGAYLVLKNGAGISTTNNINEATDLSLSEYKFSGSDEIFYLLKNGQYYITANNSYMVSYTTEAIANFSPDSKGGTMSTLRVMNPNGLTAINRFGVEDYLTTEGAFLGGDAFGTGFNFWKLVTVSM